MLVWRAGSSILCHSSKTVKCIKSQVCVASGYGYTAIVLYRCNMFCLGCPVLYIYYFPTDNLLSSVYKRIDFTGSL